MLQQAQGTNLTSHEVLFEMFSSALADPNTADKACRHLLAKFLGPDVVVQWHDLQVLDPVQTLLQAVSEGCGLPGGLALPEWESGKDEVTVWWHALLARHGLYGHGDTIGAEEFGELMVSAFRILRDCHAPASFLCNLRTVRSGASRLKERYGDFEFVSRGSLGKTYKCRSRLTREERSCRQFRKDWIMAPTDQVRSEVALLRNIDHPHLPRVVETFEDYNSVYVIVDVVDGTELMAFLHQQQAAERTLTKMWVADVLQQVLEALQYCHELHPHSIVHGDLRLDSLVLAPTSDASLAPHVIVMDLGLAGLLPAPPRNSQQPMWLCAPGRPSAAWAESVIEGANRSVSPKRDVWSCGCLLFLLLTGRHPSGGDAGGPLVPPAGEAQREPDWHLIEEVAEAALPLCQRMLDWDPWGRAGTSECLEHSWLVTASRGELQDETLPLEALQNLVQLHARSKVRQVVTNLVVSELGPDPFETLAMSLKFLNGDLVDSDLELPDILSSMSHNVAHALAHLRVSEPSLKKVVRAFGHEADTAADYAQFFAGCMDLAEDRFDHALWRIFTAAGEDHRGIIALTDLDKQLKELSGTGDILASMRAFLEQPASVLAGDAAPRQMMCSNTEVTFETLKAPARRQCTSSLGSTSARQAPQDAQGALEIDDGSVCPDEVIILTAMPEAG